MTRTYEWLFEHYASPLLEDMRLPQVQFFQQLVDSLPLTVEDRLSVVDRAADLQLQMGVEAFALGVQLGIQLNQPRPATGEARSLMEVLS